MNDISALILLPRLRAQNANAISGPLSWGFPSPTAFTGWLHALERKFVAEAPAGFAGVGIVCHEFEPQTAQPPGRRTQSFRLTRNPVGKDGGALALVEEGRTHMEVSVLIAVRDYLPESEGQQFAERVLCAAQGMRLAGGSLLHREGKRYEAQWWPLTGTTEGDAQQLRKLRRHLLPGFALVQRDDVLAEHLAQLRETWRESRAADAAPSVSPAPTFASAEPHALDALLDLCRLNFASVTTPAAADQPATVSWEQRRKSGWRVPLPIGYAGISPLYAAGEVANARDETTPFRFVESLYTLGEWVSPHRLDRLKQLLWTDETDADNGIYRCINRYSETFATYQEH